MPETIQSLSIKAFHPVQLFGAPFYLLDPSQLTGNCCLMQNNDKATFTLLIHDPGSKWEMHVNMAGLEHGYKVGVEFR